MIAMVSNMSVLQFPNSRLRLGTPRSNWCAVLCLLVFVPVSALAQASSSDQPLQTPSTDEHRVLDSVKFLAGAALGLVLHESGHLVFDVAFDADPRVSGVHFGPFPFFAISHRGDLSPRREFTISSAGFWMQDLSSEWLLTKRPPPPEPHPPLAMAD